MHHAVPITSAERDIILELWQHSHEMGQVVRDGHLFEISPKMLAGECVEFIKGQSTKGIDNLARR